MAIVKTHHNTTANVSLNNIKNILHESVGDVSSVDENNRIAKKLQNIAKRVFNKKIQSLEEDFLYLTELGIKNAPTVKQGHFLPPDCLA